MPMSQDDGAAAVNFKAARRCVYCLKRQATPDSPSCAECMRGALRVPLKPELLQNAWKGAVPPLRPGDSISVRYVKLPWWRRAWNRLRRNALP